jgi:hypothetical protein
MHGRMSVPFANDRLPSFAALPWASLLTVECEDGSTCIVAVGPARFSASNNGAGFWYLPLIEPADPGATKEASLRRGVNWREAHGVNERRTS